MRALPDKLRAFVAIRLEADVEAQVGTFVQSLRQSSELSGVRWVARTNLHVTLHFLGSAVSAAMVRRLDPMLVRIGEEASPFRLEVSGTGVFPSLARPRVIWIGLKGDGLSPFAERVIEAAGECGFASPSQPYSPHLTIGRVRERLPGASLRQVIAATTDREFGRSTVQSMILYRSVLGAGAAGYEELASYPLLVSG